MNTAPLSLTRVLLTLALFLVALGGFGALSWITYAAAADAIQSQARIGNVSTESETLRRLAFLAASSKDDRARLSALVIPAGGNAAFIGTLEALGTTARVSAAVSSISAAPPAGVKPGKLDLTVSFSGSYAQVQRFMQLLETLSLSLTVGNLSLQHDGFSWSGSISLSVLSFDTP